jgi:hypothetical protein
MPDTGDVTGGSARRAWRFARWAVVLVAVPVLLAGCGIGSGDQFPQSTKDHAYFRVPSKWKVFDERQTVKFLAQDAKLSDDELDAEVAQSWHAAFDSSPSPSLRNILNSNSKHPAGLAYIHMLGSSTSDELSLGSMRNFVLPVDQALDEDRADLLTYEQIQPDGGFHGVHLRIRIRNSPTLAEVTESYTIDQTIFVDQPTQKVYLFVVGCNSDCFSKNQRAIDKVVKSWTVKDK